MHRRIKHLRVCATVLLGCLLAPGAANRASSDTTVAPAEGLLDLDLAQGLVQDVSARVAHLRGLEFLRPVAVRIIDDDEARRHIIRRMQSFQSREELDTISAAYQLLGLLPPGTDILDSYLDALREQAGGFYDPETGAYSLLDDMPAALAPMLTAHELTHALEDQHFDLDGRLRAALHNDDRLFAASAVHEGSATLLMAAYALAELEDDSLSLEQLQAMERAEAQQAGALADLPEVLARQLYGPYILGGGFLLGGPLAQLAVRGYPADRVDAAYGEPGPLSSEQILHPEKFWDPRLRDDPQTLPESGASRWLGKGWTCRGAGVLGEITLAVLVGGPESHDIVTPTAQNTSWTVPAAAGWGGDRWELWRDGARSLVLLQTVWDTEPDAMEFLAALPQSDSLRARRDGFAVAVVAGECPEKLARKLLKKSLARSAAGAALVRSGRTG